MGPLQIGEKSNKQFTRKLLLAIQFHDILNLKIEMMMGGMGGPLASMLDNKLQTDNKLTISWVDSSWIPILNNEGAARVMDYFSDRRNPFYDPQCNNEVLRMQRASLDQLVNMTGIEYSLQFVQEPILYVIRKQQRHSPTQITPISDYYIVAGTIYQAPDLCSVVNSRLLSSISHLQSAFEETKSFSRYHPNKGYRWDFEQNNGVPYGAKKIPPPGAASNSNNSNNSDAETNGKSSKKKKKKSKESDLAKDEPSSAFQRHRVDKLLTLLTEKFPPPQVKRVVPTPATSAGAHVGDNAEIKYEKGTENSSIKSEKVEGEPGRGIKREATTSVKSTENQTKKMKFN